MAKKAKAAKSASDQPKKAEMSAQANKKKDDQMKKVYREFSREKYVKYKRQYPRMRESQVVAKIIKEWENMDEEKKEQFKVEIMKTMGKNFFKSGSSSLSKSKSKNRSKSKSTPDSKEKNKPQASSTKEASKLISKKKKKESPKIRVFEEKKKPSPKRDTSDFKRSSSKSGKPYDSSEDPSDIMAKMKGINKGKKNISFENARNSQYLQFYKYYHERLSAEHPRWTSTQITTIIKLLWKKRAKQSSGKGNLKKRIGKKGGERRISGWIFYRRIKENEGLTRNTIKEMWKALPIQSKRFYCIQGSGKRIRPKRTSGVFVRKVLNSGMARIDETKSEGTPRRDYSWMENQMN